LNDIEETSSLGSFRGGPSAAKSDTNHENIDVWIGRSVGRGLGALIPRLGLSGRAAIAAAGIAGVVIGFAVYGVVR
ncbi:MAG: hypothetical protein ACRDHY_02990, partial [Anaerolineales bacterium]